MLGRHVGPYEILSLLGAGGMGVVYRAKHLKLDRAVAIKALPAPSARTTRESQIHTRSPGARLA
jgi:serine/threonine protein kinase